MNRQYLIRPSSRSRFLFVVSRNALNNGPKRDDRRNDIDDVVGVADAAVKEFCHGFRWWMDARRVARRVPMKSLDPPPPPSLSLSLIDEVTKSIGIAGVWPSDLSKWVGVYLRGGVAMVSGGEWMSKGLMGPPCAGGG